MSTPIKDEKPSERIFDGMKPEEEFGPSFMRVAIRRIAAILDEQHAASRGEPKHTCALAATTTGADCPRCKRLGIADFTAAPSPEPAPGSREIIRAAPAVLLEPGQYEIVELAPWDDSFSHAVGQRVKVPGRQPYEEPGRDPAWYWFFDHAESEGSFVTAVRRVAPIAEPPSPVAGERRTQKVVLRDPKSADNTCDCFRDCSRCGRKPAGWFMLDGWPDAAMLCAECEPGEHSHSSDRERDEALSQVEALKAELRGYQNALPDVLRSLSPEEFEKLEPVSDAAIREALERGAREVEAVQTGRAIAGPPSPVEGDELDPDLKRILAGLKDDATVGDRERAKSAAHRLETRNHHLRANAREQLASANARAEALTKERDGYKFDAEYNVPLKELREAKRLHEMCDEECQKLDDLVRELGGNHEHGAATFIRETHAALASANAEIEKLKQNNADAWECSAANNKERVEFLNKLASANTQLATLERDYGLDPFTAPQSLDEALAQIEKLRGRVATAERDRANALLAKETGSKAWVTLVEQRDAAVGRVEALENELSAERVEHNLTCTHLAHMTIERDELLKSKAELEARVEELTLSDKDRRWREAALCRSVFAGIRAGIALGSTLDEAIHTAELSFGVDAPASPPQEQPERAIVVGSTWRDKGYLERTRKVFALNGRGSPITEDLTHQEDPDPYTWSDAAAFRNSHVWLSDPPVTPEPVGSPVDA